MRRLARTTTAVALIALGAWTSSLAAQQRPAQPPGGPPGTGGPGGGVTAAAGGGGGGGEDTAPPEIVLTVPGPNAHVYTEYPTLTVQWCDNVALSASSRWIKVNNVTRTSSFNYVAVSGACASLATSTSTTVALALGQNTIAAHICDTSNNCATEYFTVTRHEGPPAIVSLAPHSADLRDYGRCAAACFAAVYAQATVPYFTRNTPRSVTLVYNGDRVDPQPFIHVDVTHGGTGSNLPLYFQLRLQKADGSFVTFLNGETSLRFAPQAGAALRLGGQFNAAANGMGATGAYAVTVLVGAQYSGSLEEVSQPTRVLVVNETNAAVARGWTVGGIQRLLVQADGSALIAESDGSAEYFQKSGSAFVAPAGEFSSLSSAPSGFVRAYPDSTRVTFDAQGLMTRVTDRFGSATVIVYDGSARVWKIQDPTHLAWMPRELTLTYDANGLAAIQDPFQRTTPVWVDGSRDLRTITDPDGVASQLTYSGGRLATIRDRRGALTTLGYHAQAGKITSVTAPAVAIFGEGQVQPVSSLAPWQTVGVPYVATASAPFVTLRADSVRGGVTDPGGHTSAFTVNAFGQPLRATGLLGDTVTVTYDARGLATQIVDRLGATASFAYDGTGFLTQSVAGGVVMNYRNGGWGQADSVWGQGSSQRIFLNGANGRVDSTRAGGAVTRFTYDEVGRLTIARDHLNHLLVQRLDNDWGVWRDTIPSGLVSTYGYDGFGRLRTAASTGQPTDSVDYDVMNRPIRVFDGVNGSPTLLGYDSLLLTSVTDPRGQVYRFAYNALGWPTARTDPAQAVETAEYDRDGLVRRTTNRRGQAVDVTYDELHRRRIRSGTGITPDTLSYSGDGRQVTAVNVAARETAFLNARLQPDSLRTVLTIPGGPPQTYVQRYSYTSEGWLQSTWVTGAFSSQTRQYAWRPNVGLLDSLRFGASPWTRFSFTSDLLAAVTRFSGTDSIIRSFVEGHARQTLSTPGVYEDYGYDAQARLTLARVGTMGRRSAFGYDGLGRLSATTFLPPTTGCGFNPQTGLVCNGGTPDSTHAFSYDPVGNRLDHGGAYTATGNRITAFDTCTYGADGDGDVTARTCPGQGATLTWSADGRLTSYAVNGTTLAFAYDAAGRLVRRDLNGSAQRYFLWDGPNLVAELGPGGTSVVAEYAYYPGGLDNLYALAVGGATYFAKADAMGNVRALTDGNGTVRRSYDYDEWGQLASSSADYVPLNNADRARWKGALWMGPELDIYYLRNRWYEPRTGRFLSEDPIGLAGGINPYVFAGDDPINGTDPLGLQDCSVTQASRGRCPVSMNPLSVWAAGTGPEGCYLEALRPPGLGNGVVCFGSFVIGGFSTPTLGGGSFGGTIGDGGSSVAATRAAAAPSSANGAQGTDGNTRRTTSECFAQNTSWIRSENALIAATVGMGGSLSVLAGGLLARAGGTEMMVRGAVELDIFFGTRLPSSRLIESGIASRAAGSSMIRTGRGLLRGGTALMAAQAAFAVSYLGTSYALCALEPRW